MDPSVFFLEKVEFQKGQERQLEKKTRTERKRPKRTPQDEVKPSTREEMIYSIQNYL